MCGIVSILNVQEQTAELRQKALRMSQKIRHRGPDWSGIYCGGSAILAHERLSIVDPESGKQPLFSPDKKQVLAVNGEIYNHQDIRRRFARQYEFQTGSDCEVILALYREMISAFERDQGLEVRGKRQENTLITDKEEGISLTSNLSPLTSFLENLSGIFAF